MPQRGHRSTDDALPEALDAARELEEQLGRTDAAYAKGEEMLGRRASLPPAVPPEVVEEATRRSPPRGEAQSSPRSPGSEVRQRSVHDSPPSRGTSPRRKAWELDGNKDVGGERSMFARVRTIEEMHSAIDTLKRKFRARAYSAQRGGEDPEVLFKHFDRDNSGGMSLVEFVRAARTIGHIRPAQMSDDELRILFVDIDTNKPAALSQAEQELAKAKEDLAAVKHHDVEAAEELAYEVALQKQDYDDAYEKWEAEQAQSIIDIDELTNFVWDNDQVKIAEMRQPLPSATEQRIRPELPVDLDPRGLHSNELVLQKLKKKFRGLSYSYNKGQSPEALFKRFDRDSSGGLSLDEFIRASRKGGHIQKWEMSDGDLELLFDEIESGDTGADGEPSIDIHQLTRFVWDGSGGGQEESVRTPLRSSPDKSHDDLLTVNDEYASELTFSPQTLERQRARMAKETAKGVKPVGREAGAKFHAQQLAAKERTERRNATKKEQEFAETHTFQPDTKKLNKSTLAPRGAAGVLLVDADKEPTQIPLYKDGHNHQSKVFDRLHTVSPGVARHQSLKKKKEHMTNAEAMYKRDQQGLVRSADRVKKGGLAFGAIRHNPGGDQPGSGHKKAKLEATAIASLKKKLRAVSYSVNGQDPKSLFEKFDKDSNGVLSMDEFKMALIKGGQAHDMSDDEQEHLFALLDVDRDGSVSIDELTAFVWGAEKNTSDGAEEPEEQLLPTAGVSPFPPRVYGLTRPSGMVEAAGLVPHMRHKDHDDDPSLPMQERSLRSLKRELRTQGLDSTGTRFELVKRLEKQNAPGESRDRMKPKLAPGSVRSAVQSLMQGYMDGEHSAHDLASPALLIAQKRNDGLQTMLLELDVACVNVESDGASTAEIRMALKKLFEYAEAAFQRGEREHVEMLLPKLEAVSEMLATAEASVESQEEEAPELDHDRECIRRLKSKLKAMSYTHTGQDPKHLFSHFDRDNSGGLNMEEFMKACRKVGHIKKSEMSDEDLAVVFRHVDVNATEEDSIIDLNELADFVFGPDGPDSPKPATVEADGEPEEAPALPPPSKKELRQLAAAVNQAKGDLDQAKTALRNAELPETLEGLQEVVSAHKKLYRQLHARWEEGTAAAEAAAVAAKGVEAAAPPTSPRSKDLDAGASMIPRLSPARSQAPAAPWEPEPEPEPEPELVASPELSLMAASPEPKFDDLSPRLQPVSDAEVANTADYEQQLSGQWTSKGVYGDDDEEELERFLLLARAGVVPGLFTLYGCSLAGNASPGGTLESFTMRGQADLRGLLGDGSPTKIEFKQQYDDPDDPTGKPDPNEEPTNWVATVSSEMAMTQGAWSGSIRGTFEATRERELSEAEVNGLQKGAFQDLVTSALFR